MNFIGRMTCDFDKYIACYENDLWYLNKKIAENFSQTLIKTCFMEYTFDKLHNQWFSYID